MVAEDKRTRKRPKPFQLGNSLRVVVTLLEDGTTHFSGDLIFYPIFSIDRTAIEN